jgi:hypothetical protein
MATRVLPNAYVSLNDLSYFPEGQTSLTVGYVLKADKGAVNEAVLCTNPTDFLTKYTFNGLPSIKDDPTFWSILKVLARTNQVYVVRAANKPLYGGVTVAKAEELGKLIQVENGIFYVEAEEAPAEGTTFCIKGTGKIDGNYTVKAATARTGEENQFAVLVEETVEDDFVPTSEMKIMTSSVAPLDESIEDPANYEFKEGEFFLITGADPGAYNGELAFDIISSVDNAAQLVYSNTMQLNVRVAATGELLESYVFSRDPQARAIDGTSLFVDNVVAGSAYIKIFNNENIAADLLPVSTLAGFPVKAGAGSNGEEVNEYTMVGALNVFADKTIPISIIGNGCSAEAETPMFQQAMLELADTRKDLMVFLNSRATDEVATLNSTKAAQVVDYKKNTLASTSFYGAMYAPHLNTADTFNSRQVKIGCDGVAIAGWLNVINNLNYPYAYAGPQNGLVTGVTCDWKIGDESGEAQALNDASINYVAFDGKVGRYYMQCQNTLQIANSSLRNIGCVLNVLDLKEHISTSLKEYCNLPITNVLRRDILNAMNSYLSPMVGTRFYNYAFIDITTEADIAQDTLRYNFYVDLTRYAARIYCFINIVNNTFDWTIVQSA